MGTTSEMLALFPAEERTDLPPQVAGEDALSEDGWLVIAVADPLSPNELETVVQGWDRAGRARRAIAALVEDGDYLYVTAFGPGGVVRHVIGPESADGTLWGGEALALTRQTRNVLDDLVERLAAIRESKALDATGLRSLSSREWVDHVDALEALFASLRLPLPDVGTETLFESAAFIPQSGRVRVFGKEVDLSSSRFVFGWGEGFLGIWDRETPGPPLHRFELSTEGQRQALHELNRLLTDEHG